MLRLVKLVISVRLIKCEPKMEKKTPTGITRRKAIACLQICIGISLIILVTVFGDVFAVETYSGANPNDPPGSKSF